MGHIIGIGHSAGGLAMLALAARNQPPLAAVANVSGGLAPHQLGPFRSDPACNAYTSDMVWNFARFGATAHMPTLWLYSENDVWFRPGLVSRMRAAFSGSGGAVDLAMLPPFAENGHTMFYASGGRDLLLPELDRFLRTHGLPTWDEQAFAPVLADMSASDRQVVDHYLRDLPAEKALAIGSKGGVFWRADRWSTEDARDGVLSYCREQTGGDCRLAAEDFQPVLTGPSATPRP